MNVNYTFLAGTLLTWIAWALVFRGVVLAAAIVMRAPGVARGPQSRGIATAAVSAAVLFLVATPLLTSVPDTTPATWRFPLVWLVMPFWGWLSVVSILMAVLRLVQAGLAPGADRLKAAGIWLLVLAVSVWLYKRDPGNHIATLTGGITLSPATALAVLLLAVAATFAMIFAGREAKTRRLANAFAAQIALLTGSVVFGIPFVFLLITSFKESRDMSSPNGIVWVPRVSQTTPYFDKQDPQYEAVYKGQRVTCHVIEHLPENRVQVEIMRPLSSAGTAFEVPFAALKEVPNDVPLVTGTLRGERFTGAVVKETPEGLDRVRFSTPASLANQEQNFPPADLEPIRKVGLDWRNYPDALEYLPAESNLGFVYLKNTLFLVVMSVLGTLLSSAVVAYGFSRLRFPGRNALFGLMLGTMMLPGAVTLLPTFLVFKQLHAIDTLYPLWVPSFCGSAFNIFMMRQFFMQIPMELEDAAKIDGCSYLATFWKIMMPQMKPVLTVVAIWAFMGAWNDFMGPLIYLNSPERMPLSYALQLFQGDHGSTEPGLVMAFATLCMLPVLCLFFFAQRYFIEGVTLSGLGGR